MNIRLGSKIVFSGLVLFGAVCLSHAKEPVPPAPVPPAKDITALQADILETTRKTAENAIEQTRRMAELSVQNAHDANETLKTVIASGTAIFGVVIAILAWFGWKEFSNLKTDLSSRMDARFNKELSDRLDKFNEQLANARETTIDTGRQLSVMASELAFFNIGKARITTAQPGAEQTKRASEVGPDLMVNLKEIESIATTVDDKRTLSWAFAERALLFYYAEHYVEAVTEQEKAVALNPKQHFDRKLNLACMATRAFDQNNMRADLLQTAKRAVTELQPTLTAMEAKQIVDDPDLAKLFEKEPALKASLQTKITG